MSQPKGRHLSQRGASPWIAMLARGGRPFCAGSLLGKPILGEMLQEIKNQAGNILPVVREDRKMLGASSPLLPRGSQAQMWCL